MALIFRIWQIAATYMGAIIGAGFASGQELVRFFVLFGIKGVWGILFAGMLFAILGIIIVVFVNKKGIKSYQQLTFLLFSDKLGFWIEILIGLLLWIGLGVMFAGSGAIFAEHWNIDKVWGISFTLVVVGISLAFKGGGVKWVNSLLVPLLIFITVYISMVTIIGKNNAQFPWPQNLEYGFVGDNWLVASIIYVAYNMILGIVILASLESEVMAAKWGAFLGGLLLGILGMIKILALLAYFPDILKYQIPMLFLASQHSEGLKLLFALALWSAMATTAIANGYGLIKRLEVVNQLNYNRALILILLLSLPLAQLRFSQLVVIFYPIFGYISLILVGMIFTKMISLIFKG